MNSCFVIAEIGVNHNGSLATAKTLVDIAKDAGADAVKFQTFKTDALVTKSAKQAEYQVKNNPESSQHTMLRKLELSRNDTIELKQYADMQGIMFLSSPFDVDSVAFLHQMGVEMMKVGSGEITNRFLLEAIAKTRLPVILSTGMSTLGEVEDALDILREQSVTLLHCTTSYPTPFEDVDLNSMITLRDSFGCTVGYSDHTKGYEVAIAAVAMGAKVIEKHLTYDCSAIGPDHKASLEPDEFSAMVRSIRNIESAFGSARKTCRPSEETNRDVARKSLVFARNMEAGEIIREEDMTAKRPGYGISPMELGRVIGFTLARSVELDEVLTWELLKGGNSDVGRTR